MIKRKMPVILHFDNTVEYSKDDGQTWITLNADTPIEIPDEELSSGKVMVRSTEDIQQLDPDKLEFNRRLYEYINIKNAKSLTTINSLFKYGLIDKIRINNLNNVANADNAFEMCTSDTIFIGQMNNVNTVEKMFNRARIKLLSNIVLGNNLDNIVSAEWMFAYSDIKVSGDINIKSKSILRSEGMFYSSNIDFFPYLNMTLDTSDFDNANYKHMRIFTYMKSKYMLNGTLIAKRINSTTFARREAQFGFDGQSEYNGFMSKSKNHFVGLVIDSEMNNYNNYYFAYTWTKSINLKYPFSMLIQRYSSIMRNDYLSNAISDTQIAANVQNYGRVAEAHSYLEIPYWMPDVIELESYIAPNIVSATNVLVKDFTIEIVKGTQSIRTNKVDRFDSVDFSELFLNNYNADLVFGSRSGYRVFKRGTDFEIRSPDGITISTFTDSDNIVAGSFFSDGSKLYIVEATKYDEQAGGDQQLSATVKIYNTATGSKLEEKILTLPSSYEVIGIHKPDEDANMQIIMRKWEDDGNGNYVEVNSVIQAIKNDIIQKEIQLSKKVNLVGLNYWEDAEFMCFNTTTGDCVRCFGK